MLAWFHQKLTFMYALMPSSVLGSFYLPLRFLHFKTKSSCDGVKHKFSILTQSQYHYAGCINSVFGIKDIQDDGEKKKTKTKNKSWMQVAENNKCKYHISCNWIQRLNDGRSWNLRVGKTRGWYEHEQTFIRCNNPRCFLRLFQYEHQQQAINWNWRNHDSHSVWKKSMGFPYSKWICNRFDNTNTVIWLLFPCSLQKPFPCSWWNSPLHKYGQGHM